jgi:hypothetical protein
MTVSHPGPVRARITHFSGILRIVIGKCRIVIYFRRMSLSSFTPENRFFPVRQYRTVTAEDRAGV